MLSVPSVPTLFEDPGFRIAVYRNVLISVWTSPPTGARLAAFRRGQSLLATQPDPLGALTILLQSSADSKIDLSEPVRAELVKLWRTGNTRRGASVVAIEMEGMVAAGLRALLSTTKIIARSVNPSTFVRTRGEAIRWIAPFLRTPEQPGPSEEELRVVVASLCAGLGG